MSVFIGNTSKSDKLTPRQKRRLLADIVYFSAGYDVDEFFGRPLSYYNWTNVIKMRDRLEKESQEQY